MPRASPIIEAVRSAVPDGASILFAWCSSMTSAESKNRAAWAAKRIISTAPTEKFGAMSTRAVGAVGQPGAHLGQPVVAEARGADDDGHRVLDAPAQVVHHRGDVRKVHHDIAAEQCVEWVALVHLRGQLRIRRFPHGLADGTPHSPLGAKDSDLDHYASRSLAASPACQPQDSTPPGPAPSGGMGVAPPGE